MGDLCIRCCAVLENRPGFLDFHCIISLLFDRKNVSPVIVLGAEFDSDVQNWAKVLGMAYTGVQTRKFIDHPPGVSTRAPSMRAR